MNRSLALELLDENVQDPGLQRHMRAVEAAMRWYARRLGASQLGTENPGLFDEEQWGLAGLLHDYDWEIHPTLEDHPLKGSVLLREKGFAEPVVRAILAHNTAGTGVEREAPIDFALLACDEITGLIIAGALVRPSKDVRQMKVKSVKRNWKDKHFTAAIDREEVRQASEDFSHACFGGKLELWEHVGNVLEAMQGIAEDLELDGRMAAT